MSILTQQHHFYKLKPLSSLISFGPSSQSKQMQEYSALFNIMLHHLIKHPSVQELNDIVIEEPLDLLTSQVKHVVFATDLSHNVQLAMPHNIKSMSQYTSISPVNMSSAIYYQQVVEGKYELWQPYITSKENLLQPPQEYPDAYSPQHFLGKHYVQFTKGKFSTSKAHLNCRKIHISSWKIKVVNISRTGWYAPVIEPVSFKFLTTFHEAFQCDFSHTSLILYEEPIKELMESMRLSDMRKERKGNRLNGSILMHLSNEQSLRKDDVSIGKADLQHEILQFKNERSSVNMISTNEISRIFSLQPTLEDYLAQKTSKCVLRTLFQQIIGDQYSERALQMQQQALESEHSDHAFQSHVNDFLDNWSDQDDEQVQNSEDLASKRSQIAQKKSRKISELYDSFSSNSASQSPPAQ